MSHSNYCTAVIDHSPRSNFVFFWHLQLFGIIYCFNFFRYFSVFFFLFSFFCVLFSSQDPFSSFGGEGSTARFKKNADNLGKLVLNPSMRITNYNIDYSSEEGSVEIKKNKNDDLSGCYDCVRVGLVFSSKLNLPWKPVLAAAGETRHYLDPG